MKMMMMMTMNLMMRRRAVVYAMVVVVLLLLAAAAAAGSSSYISYGSLKAGNVPCPQKGSQKGSSYSDCSSASAANPYHRSCTQYATCYHIANS